MLVDDARVLFYIIDRYWLVMPMLNSVYSPFLLNIIRKPFAFSYISQGIFAHELYFRRTAKTLQELNET